MSATKKIIDSYIDSDFGKLNLIETQTMAAVNGGPMKPLVFRNWSGKIPATEIEILINSENNPPVIPDEIRIAFKKIMADTDSFKQKVAADQLELAKEWAEDGELNIELNEENFTKLLKIKGFSTDPERLTVWLAEEANIFAGHEIEVRIENGKIQEISLAG